MCRHKDIRKKLGTVHYKQTEIVLPDPKKQYDEIHALIKREKKKTKSKSEPKIVDIKKMTKEDQIKSLIDLPLDEPTLDNSTHDKDLLFAEEPIEIKSGSNKQEEAEKEVEKEIEKEVEKEVEAEDEKEGNQEEQKNIIQEGGLMKKIYVTDLSVDKDKEMFQM
jgi:hypothetical protein